MSEENRSEQNIKDAIHSYIAAYENDDIEAVMAIYADGCTVEDPVGSTPKVGKAAVREFYQSTLGHGVRLELESQIRIAANQAAFAFTATVPSEQGVMHISPIDVMVFNERGKVSSMKAFFGPSNMTMSE